MYYQPFDEQYLELVKWLYFKRNYTPIIPDRTGTGVIAKFGHSFHIDLQQEFPLIQCKKTHWKSIVYELLWFLKGDTNIQYLKDNGVTIWDEWADESGEVGPMYGKQWVSWGKNVINQIQNVLQEIKTNPFSRRLVVSAWNVDEIPDMALAPCHTMFQFMVEPDSGGLPNKLHTVVYQRSADVFLGVPFNVASYALLANMVAQYCGLNLGTMTYNMGHVHLYCNHFDAALQLIVNANSSKDDNTWLHITPRVAITTNYSVKGLADTTFDEIKLFNYDPLPAIKAPVAV